MQLTLPDTITTFDTKDLQKCSPTGRTRDGGKLLLVEHPVHGPRWVRCGEWAEAVPRVTPTPLGRRST